MRFFPFEQFGMAGEVDECKGDLLTCFIMVDTDFVSNFTFPFFLYGTLFPFWTTFFIASTIIFLPHFFR